MTVFLFFFAFYWGVAGFTTLMVVAERRRVTFLDAIVAVIFGGVIIPASIIYKAVR